MQSEGPEKLREHALSPETVAASSRWDRTTGLGIALLAWLVAALSNSGSEGPLVFRDEFGYIASAAYLVGIDWSHWVAGIPNYAVGYSLLLAPIFWLCDEPGLSYRAAVFFNTLLVGLIGYLAYRVGREIFPGLPPSTTGMAALATSLYPAYAIYSAYAWSESLLAALYWTSAWMVLGIARDASARRCYLLTALLGVIYVVHPRAVGILLAGLAVLALVCLQRSTRKEIIRIIGIVAVIVAADYALRSYLHANLWLGEVPGYGQGRRTAMLGMEGLKTIVTTAAGQLFYFGAAGLLAAFMGVAWGCGQISSGFQSRDRSVKPTPLSRLALSPIALFAAFVVVSSLLVFAVSVLYLSVVSDRADQLVYGRYNETVMGPLFLLGLLFGISSGRGVRKHLVACLAGLGVAAVSLWWLAAQELAQRKTSLIHITGFYAFHDAHNGLDVWVILLGLGTTATLFWLAFLKWPRVALTGVCVLFLLTIHINVQFRRVGLTDQYGRTLGIAEWLATQGPGDRTIAMDTYAPDQKETSPAASLAGNVARRYQFRLWETPLLDIRRTPGDLEWDYLITPASHLESPPPDAELIRIEHDRNFLLWARRGSARGQSSETLAAPTLESPSGSAEEYAVDPLSLTAEDYRARVEIHSDAPVTIWRARARLVSLRGGPFRLPETVRRLLRPGEVLTISVTHEGRRFSWPMDVRLGWEWKSPDGRTLSTGEVPLPRYMRPGETRTVTLPLHPTDPTGAWLPRGEYTLQVGLKHGQAWFPGNRGAIETISVIVR